MIINPYFFNQPSFYRSFVTQKSLNHGAGPAITFFRGSSATYFDSNRILRIATLNEPRFDHDFITGESKGLFIEKSSLNNVGNSLTLSATWGPTVYTSNAALRPNLPYSWWSDGALSPMTLQIVGSGTEKGLIYWDYKFRGNPTSTNRFAIVPVNGSNTTRIFEINVSPFNTFSSSVYLAAVSGSINNVEIYQRFTATGGTPSENSYIQNIANLLTSELRRFTHTHTFTAINGTRRLQYEINFGYTNGLPVDITLRIAGAQLEQLFIPTSYIPTTDGPLSRAVDVAFVQPVSSFYNQKQGTFIVECTVPYGNNTSDFIMEFGNSTNAAARMSLRLDSGILVYDIRNVNLQSTTVGSGLTANNLLKFGGSYSVSPVNYYLKRDGLYNTQAITLPPPSGINTMSFGNDTSPDVTTPEANIYFRKISYYPSQLVPQIFNSLV